MLTEEPVKRRLTTILVADVVGYSRLMHTNEEATLKQLEASRELLAQLVKQHEGRIFNTGGDSVLAEFDSAVEAVRCAALFQKENSKFNTGIDSDDAIKFRIGINIGDVMIRDGDLFGDGVNIAARLEGLGEPDGICISANVFEQIKNKVPFEFENMGPQEVKNIAEPVNAYRMTSTGSGIAAGVNQTAAKSRRLTLLIALVALLIAGGLAVWLPWSPKVETASVDRMALPLPNKPSIAVLPFQNLGNDPKQEVFSDGLS